MYGKARFKTTAARQWSGEVFHYLNIDENAEKLTELREKFNHKKHYFSVTIKAYIPKKILFTKSGHLSQRAHDLSNIEKPLIDLFFLPDYCGKKPPYGCNNINRDDKYVLKLNSEKLVSKTDEHYIEITIEIHTLHQI